MAALAPVVLCVWTFARFVRFTHHYADGKGGARFLAIPQGAKERTSRTASTRVRCSACGGVGNMTADYRDRHGVALSPGCQTKDRKRRVGEMEGSCPAGAWVLAVPTVCMRYQTTSTCGVCMASYGAMQIDKAKGSVDVTVPRGPRAELNRKRRERKALWDEEVPRVPRRQGGPQCRRRD